MANTTGIDSADVAGVGLGVEVGVGLGVGLGVGEEVVCCMAASRGAL